MARELKLRHYSMARRHPGSVNRQEIIKLIEDTFIDKTDIDRGALMREARL